MLNEPEQFPWPPNDRVLSLAPDEVQVWLIQAEDAEVDPASCADILMPAEKARADKFKFAKDRRLFTTAHAALRSILSRYVAAPPACLKFDVEGNGKPRLAGALAASGIEFNLSHSHEMAMVAVCRESQVGIDIEIYQSRFCLR